MRPEDVRHAACAEVYGDYRFTDLTAGWWCGLGIVLEANLSARSAPFLKSVHGTALGHRRQGSGEPDRADASRLC